MAKKPMFKNMFGSMGHSQDADHWRQSNDYRGDFFRYNPGFFGLYLCHYCGRPLTKSGNHILGAVEVDHVVAPSKFANKKVKYSFFQKVKLFFFPQAKKKMQPARVTNTSVLARALNHEINLVPACQKCNRTKSDKGGMWIVRGLAAKTVSKSTTIVAGLLIMLFVLLFNLLVYILKVAGKLLMKPLKMKSAWYVKLGILGIYAGFVWFVFIR